MNGAGRSRREFVGSPLARIHAQSPATIESSRARAFLKFRPKQIARDDTVAHGLLMPNTAGATDPLSTTLRRQPEPRAQTLSTYEVFSILENRACRTENAQIPKNLHWKLKMERNSSLNNREREKNHSGGNITT